MKTNTRGSQLLPADEQRLLEDAARWLCDQDALTPAHFAELSAIRGIDFATAALYQYFRNRPQACGLLESCSTACDADQLAELRPLLAIVPGAFYREYPHTGADGQTIRHIAESHGWETELVPVRSNAPPSVNGRCILDWLDVRDDRPVALLSLSKGSVDLKAALLQADECHDWSQVLGWISMGGILNGSPMAGWILQRKFSRLFYRGLFHWAGHSFGMIEELDYARTNGDGLIAAHHNSLRHADLIHVAGFPLRKHLSCARARRWHKRLSVYGPNDSVTVLADMAQWPGMVWPVWGTDHYLNEQWQPAELIPQLLTHFLQRAPALSSNLSSSTRSLTAHPRVSTRHYA